MLFQYAANFFKWDDEKMARSAIMGPLNGIFIFSDLVGKLMSAAFGFRSFDKKLPFMAESLEFFNALGDMFTDIDDLELDELLLPLEAVRGIPVKNLGNALRGAGDFLEGKEVKGMVRMLGGTKRTAEGVAK